LFRSSSKTHIRDTVLIFLTPTIIQATDFQPALGNFEKTRDSLMPTAKDGPWLSAQPYDWTKPKPVVQPVYQP
jgi:type II secretory pathway component GspD/PulD (secretin)